MVRAIFEGFGSGVLPGGEKEMGGREMGDGEGGGEPDF